MTILKVHWRLVGSKGLPFWSSAILQFQGYNSNRTVMFGAVMSSNLPTCLIHFAFTTLILLTKTQLTLPLIFFWLRLVQQWKWSTQKVGSMLKLTSPKLQTPAHTQLVSPSHLSSSIEEYQYVCSFESDKNIFLIPDWSKHTYWN